jgi:AcrR family transcriptional regulator
MARKVVPEKMEAAKEKIISATMDVIIDDGLSKLTLANVARKAGITKAAIYWYFSGKDELIGAMAATLRETFIGGVKQLVALPIPPKQKIEVLFDELENNDVIKKCFLLTKLFIELKDNQAMENLQAGHMEYIGLIKEIFDEAFAAGEINSTLSSESLAKILVAMTNGCIIHNKTLPNQSIDFKEVKEFFYQLAPCTFLSPLQF